MNHALNTMPEELAKALLGWIHTNGYASDFYTNTTSTILERYMHIYGVKSIYNVAKIFFDSPLNEIFQYYTVTDEMMRLFKLLYYQFDKEILLCSPTITLIDHETVELRVNLPMTIKCKLFNKFAITFPQDTDDNVMVIRLAL